MFTPSTMTAYVMATPNRSMASLLSLSCSGAPTLTSRKRPMTLPKVKGVRFETAMRASLTIRLPFHGTDFRVILFRAEAIAPISVKMTVA